MSEIANLSDVHVNRLQDLWSANDPMARAVIIAQYQRMTHHGSTRYGTSATFSDALKLQDDKKKPRAAVKGMHPADELMTGLAQAAVNADAVAV